MTIISLAAARRGGGARRRKGSSGGGQAAPDGAAVTEDWLALQLAVERGGMARFDHTTGQWLVWGGHRWERNGNGLVVDWIRELVRRHAAAAPPADRKRLEKAGTIRGVEALAQADRAFAVEERQFDTQPRLLGTPGGVVDLETGELRAGRPDELISMATSVTPAPPGTPCPAWEDFLRFATAADEDGGALYRYVQCMAGYALTGETSEQKLFFLFGSGGNGKGVFVDTIREAMGEYATAAPMEMFTASFSERHPTELTILHKRRLVCADETEEGRRWHESRIKVLTGQGEITARRMREDNWTFQPTHKLWFAGNHKPGLHSVDDAVRRRFQMLPFERKPPAPDPDLRAKLRAELPAILRWLVDGAVQWLAEGLPEAVRIDEATASYLEGQDIIGQWLEDKCETQARPLGPAARVADWFVRRDRRPDDPTIPEIWGAPIGLLHKSLADYLEMAGEKPWSLKRLSQELDKRGFVFYRSGPARWRLGLRLRQGEG